MQYKTPEKSQSIRTYGRITYIAFESFKPLSLIPQYYSQNIYQSTLKDSIVRQQGRSSIIFRWHIENNFILSGYTWKNLIMLLINVPNTLYYRWQAFENNFLFVNDTFLHSKVQQSLEAFFQMKFVLKDIPSLIILGCCCPKIRIFYSFV